MQSTIDTIHAMRRQEQQAYLTHDYLQLDPAATTSELESAAEGVVNVNCRTKMISWCFQVADFCKFDRETVSIAINCLDRFLATSVGRFALLDRGIFQLAIMTCLYTAVKVHEPEAMAPELVSNLSRGAYTTTEIEQMESSILDALEWRLNPPTSAAFARMFLKLIPNMDSKVHDAVYDLVKYQTELAVSDFRLINASASTIGFFAVINALESVGMDNKALFGLTFSMSRTAGIDLSDSKVAQIQEHLYQIVGGNSSIHHPQQRTAVVADATPKFTRRTSVEVSPQSVAAALR